MSLPSGASGGRPWPALLEGGRLLWVLAALLAAAPAAGAQEVPARKDYAYLLVQGTITDPSQGRPMQGAVVRLARGDETHEATTDERGMFRFEKLPISAYRMTVVSSRGEVVQRMRAVDLDMPNLKRFQIGFGRGDPAEPALVEPSESGVRVIAADPPVRQGRFWKQFAIFLGCAGLLAL